jgi:hypothetical protein
MKSELSDRLVPIIETSDAIGKAGSALEPSL